MLSPAADRLAGLVVKAKKRKEKIERLAFIGGAVFTGTTGLLLWIVLKDARAFFTDPSRIQFLWWWLVPAGFYIAVSRMAAAAAREWGEVQSLAARQARPGFCSHDAPCSCRQEFLGRLEAHGIDLHEW